MSILKTLASKQRKSTHLLEFASHWKDEGNCQYSQLHSKKWNQKCFRPKAGKCSAFPTNSRTHVPLASCYRHIDQRPVSKPSAACAHQSAAEHRPCPANIEMRIKNTLSALDCPSLSGNTASLWLHYLHTDHVIHPMYKHNLPHTMRFSCSPSCPMLTKTHTPYLKWNVSPCVVRSQSLLEAMSSNC